MSAVFVATLLLCSASTASAGDGGGWGGVTEPEQPSSEGKPDGIASRVQFSVHRAPSSGGAAMTAVQGADWEPPACWYEPRYSPEEFSAYATKVDVRHGEGANGQGGVRARYPDMHIGDKGEWYVMRYNTDTTSGTPEECLDQDGFVFIGPGHPAPADAPVLDAEILAGLAYQKARLPAPPLTLSPKAGRQVVNLATHVRFARTLGRVWVTAAIDQAGRELAATTVAEPVRLRLAAGTTDADPASCTYDLVKDAGGGYSVNTEDAECNIVYRRVTAEGTRHTLRAALTWRVFWSEGPGPEGRPRRPMPEGESVGDVAVTVKEIQAVNRD
ncbi:hypothetical protein [Streptomyces sp. AA1529]|uniref:hypothetical protein n=1 Tax=Streptomyces sp. AA1529 TaxID=1203257 RepID=UPI003D712F37